MTAGCSERHIHAADLPAAAVAHDETCGLFLDRPGRREAACINSVATYDLNWSVPPAEDGTVNSCCFQLQGGSTEPVTLPVTFAAWGIACGKTTTVLLPPQNGHKPQSPQPPPNKNWFLRKR
jgi:hypothetical protein